MLKAGEIAQASASKVKVINMLQLPGGPGSQQVMLQVRFAEVNRRAIQELGVNLFMGPNGENDYVARTTTGQFTPPGLQPGYDDVCRLPESVRDEHEVQHRGRD